jgi:hypothetical protein
MLRMAISLADPAVLCHLAEMAVVTGDEEMMAALSKPLEPKKADFAHWGLMGMVWEGPVRRYLALLADGMGDAASADQLFDRARDQCLAAGATPMTARIAYEHARSLARRKADEDAQRATRLLEEGKRTAKRLELSGLLAQIENLQNDLGESTVKDATPPDTVSTLPSVTHFGLRRDGEIWLCECEGQTFQLKNTKGIRILAHLVQHPGREFHVLDLTGVSSPTDAADTGDAGEVLDDTARAQYQQRVEVLQAELEEAEAWNDVGRVERAREELDLIAGELSKAFGLGGRKRRSGSAAERARVNVQRRLRDAVKRIEQHSPAAAKHLSWGLKTGTYCIYDPSL